MKSIPKNFFFKKCLSRTLSRISFLLPDKYFLISYFGGKIYLNLKESRMMMARALGVYEYWKTRLFFNKIIEGMTIIDVGVNKGYFSLLFAKLMNGKGKVLSFEPEPINCLWFKKSIQANKYQCIKLFQLALSDKEGNISFYRGKKSGWGSLFPSKYMKDEVITVKTRKLDSVLKDEGITKVDIMKIDVEGADILVLKGAEKTLKKCNLQLVMDVDVKSVEKRNKLFDFLESCGFKIFSIGKELTPIKKIDERIKDIYAIKPDSQ